MIAWIESSLEKWFEIISESVKRGYCPHDCPVCEAPKGGWMVRPGSVIDIRDEVVVNAILGRFHKELWNILGGMQGDPDIAYQFQREPNKDEWVRSGFPIRKQWREKSLKKLTKSTRFVLFADISGFYENIDLPRLSSDLRAAGIDQESLNVLVECLRRWSQPRGKGIPQGYSGSDILAKLYLNPVDRALKAAGFAHLRYVDDIRIFCKSNLEAKRALLKLNELLRNRGLNLQTAKTQILQKGDARRKIDGVSPTIDAIQEQLAEELRDVWSIADASGTLADIEAIVGENSETPTLEVLERAFHDYFASGSDQEFNKTLFHFLIARLGKARSRIAVKYCLDLISSRPEETTPILRYFKSVTLTYDELGQIIQYAGSLEALYDYQLFEIVRWFVQTQDSRPEHLIHLCRRWRADKNRATWLRSWSLALIGELGEFSDLEDIEHSYGPSNTELENAEIVSATSKMEASRRNAFYKRVRNDCELVRRAVDAVRAGKSPSQDV